MVSAWYFAVEPDVSGESVVLEVCPSVASCDVGAELCGGVHAAFRAWDAVHASFVFDADC